MWWTTRVLNVLLELLVVVRRMLKVARLKRPGLVFLKMIAEKNNMLTFVLTLPPPGASDVVKRQVTVAIGGDDHMLIEYDSTTRVTEEMSGSDNDTVVGSLVDVDDAGNFSAAREFSFVLTDTIPPPQPGEVGIAIVFEL